jgi:hypothetical protein
MELLMGSSFLSFTKKLAVQAMEIRLKGEINFKFC